MEFRWLYTPIGRALATSPQAEAPRVERRPRVFRQPETELELYAPSLSYADRIILDLEDALR